MLRGPTTRRQEKHVIIVIVVVIVIVIVHRALCSYYVVHLPWYESTPYRPLDGYFTFCARTNAVFGEAGNSCLCAYVLRQ